jgi:putative oxidoreductase
MNANTSNNYGAMLLRISLGIVILAHSAYLKLMVFTLPGTAQFFASIGLPGPFAYIVFIVEVITGVALIIGFYTRSAALALIPITLGATWAHFGAGWLFSNEGGGWEYPLFLTIALAVQALLGSGTYAFRKS